MPRQMFASDELPLPEGVEVTVSKRLVTVKGKRGTLQREFKHVNMTMAVDEEKRTFNVEMWFGTNKQQAAIKTILSHVRNMITGVTKGYRYRLRFAYAHFPVNVTVADDKGQQVVEVRNFLGEKFVRRVAVKEGVVAKRTDPSKVKDELTLEGNDIEQVSGTAADIHTSCLVRNKDIRKFLDGIYVQYKEHIEE